MGEEDSEMGVSKHLGKDLLDREYVIDAHSTISWSIQRSSRSEILQEV